MKATLISKNYSVMTVTLKQAKQIVQRVSTSNCYDLYGNGYEVHHTQIIPAIRRFKKSADSPKDRLILAEALNRIGDLYDFYLSAPNSALHYYRQCAAYNPNHRFAWDDIARNLAELGHYKQAVMAWRHATRVIRDHHPDAHDELPFYQSEIDVVLKSMRDGDPPNCQYDPFGEVCGLLAQSKAKVALDRLRGKRGVNARRFRAQAYSILGDDQAALKEWKAIADLREGVSIWYSDWFYFSDAIWDDPEFWRLMLKIGRRFEFGHYPLDEWVPRLIPEPPRAQWNSAATQRRTNRRFLLMTRLRVARLTDDLPAAKKLLKKYPKWKAAKQLVKKLSRN